MLWALWMSVAAHQGEAADPRLLEWIKHRLDDLLGLGPWTAVVLLGGIIVAIPLGVMGFYLYQRRREADSDPG